MNRSSYPNEIAEAIVCRWHQGNYSPTAIPPSDAIAFLVDTMYQASLLREEAEPVQCRIMICSPTEIYDRLKSRKSDFQALRFIESCELSPEQIRKLAKAAGYYRALLAVQVENPFSACVWGVIHSGTEWVNRFGYLSDAENELPIHLVIHCLGPGHLIASAGERRLLESSNGRILTEGFDPFRSKWLPQRFGGVRADLIQTVDFETNGLPEAETRMCDDFVKDLAQSVVRRTLRVVRSRGQGGTLIYLPDGFCDSPQLHDWVRFRVLFYQDDATWRFRRLMLAIIGRARAVGHSRGLQTITYQDYRRMRDPELASYEEELVELGNFLADLMSVDGALAMDRNFRLIGFGGEILGDSHVSRIHRALNLEATETVEERADTSGTRHRSAYRLCSGLSETITVIVSQDGDVRFVATHNGKLTYWPYLP